MQHSVVRWLAAEQPPAHLYELLGVRLFDPDVAALRAAISAGARELLPYQNHKDAQTARKAMDVLKMLGGADNVVSHEDKLNEYIHELYSALEGEYAQSHGTEATRWNRGAFTEWLVSEHNVHRGGADDVIDAFCPALSSHDDRGTSDVDAVEIIDAAEPMTVTEFSLPVTEFIRPGAPQAAGDAAERFDADDASDVTAADGTITGRRSPSTPGRAGGTRTGSGRARVFDRHSGAPPSGPQPGQRPSGKRPPSPRPVANKSKSQPVSAAPLGEFVEFSKLLNDLGVAAEDSLSRLRENVKAGLHRSPRSRGPTEPAGRPRKAEPPPIPSTTQINWKGIWLIVAGVGSLMIAIGIAAAVVIKQGQPEKKGEPGNAAGARAPQGHQNIPPNVRNAVPQEKRLPPDFAANPPKRDPPVVPPQRIEDNPVAQALAEAKRAPLGQRLGLYEKARDGAISSADKYRVLEAVAADRDFYRPLEIFRLCEFVWPIIGDPASLDKFPGRNYELSSSAARILGAEIERRNAFDEVASTYRRVAERDSAVPVALTRARGMVRLLAEWETFRAQAGPDELFGVFDLLLRDDPNGDSFGRGKVKLLVGAIAQRKLDDAARRHYGQKLKTAKGSEVRIAAQIYLDVAERAERWEAADHPEIFRAFGVVFENLPADSYQRRSFATRFLRTASEHGARREFLRYQLAHLDDQPHDPATLELLDALSNDLLYSQDKDYEIALEAAQTDEARDRVLGRLSSDQNYVTALTRDEFVALLEKVISSSLSKKLLLEYRASRRRVGTHNSPEEVVRRTVQLIGYRSDGDRKAALEQFQQRLKENPADEPAEIAATLIAWSTITKSIRDYGGKPQTRLQAIDQALAEDNSDLVRVLAYRELIADSGLLSEMNATQLYGCYEFLILQSDDAEVKTSLMAELQDRLWRNKRDFSGLTTRYLNALSRDSKDRLALFALAYLYGEQSNGRFPARNQNAKQRETAVKNAAKTAENYRKRLIEAGGSNWLNPAGDEARPGASEADFDGGVETIRRKRTPPTMRKRPSF